MAVSEPKGDPSPPQNAASNTVYAPYVPHDLKYNASFEDSIMATVLDDRSPRRGLGGLRIIPDGSDEKAEPGVSVRAQDISAQSLPEIREDDLPLALGDSRRKFASRMPGVKLTHPGGYLEGGPGLDPDMDTFPDDFFANHSGINTAAQLKKAVANEVDSSIDLLKERAKSRQEAKEKNEQVERELKTLMDNHDMELKMQRRMAEENQRKRDAREKKRLAKSGG